ncbi:MAG: Regulator of sigma D [Candidatus Erwinia impunctatus]|nr:Regulator of sigma D [Culicoides impunctatus]
MLNQLENLTARIGGCNDLVDFCLQSRKALLIHYYQLIGIKPNKDIPDRFSSDNLDTFCHHLVDYLSSGHFTIYQRFVTEMKGSEQLAKAALIYPALQVNTNDIMQTYDNHLEPSLTSSPSEGLHLALSSVGEALEARFSLEDKFIQFVLDKNQSVQIAANDSTLATRPAG